MQSTIPEIPTPQLRVVENQTPFSVFQADKMAPGRRFHDTVVVKGAFELRPGTLRPLGAANIMLADEPWDPANAERSSIKVAGDVVLYKPGTDVIVTGTARAPEGRPVQRWDVAVAVSTATGAPVLNHTLRVTGPRRWEHRAVRGWTLSDPTPSTEVAIRYELAYGGAYFDEHAGDNGEWVVCDANPSGLGFCDVEALDKTLTYPAAQWEQAAHPIGRLIKDVPLAGLGPISRSWSARRGYAGTYDGGWQRRAREDAANGLPLDYAEDLDPQFFQCAHPALIARTHLRGDEQFWLVGLLGGPNELFSRLPGISVRASLSDTLGRLYESTLPLDTVHFDLDAEHVYLSWRLSMDQGMNISTAVLHAEGQELS